MAMLEKSINTFNLATANPTTLLAASATVTRWIRGITLVNNGAAGTWNFGATTTATLTAANAIWFGTAIGAGATFVHFFPGRGMRLGGTDIIAGFASAANMTLEVSYTEQDLT